MSWVHAVFFTVDMGHNCVCLVLQANLLLGSNISWLSETGTSRKKIFLAKITSYFAVVGALALGASMYKFCTVNFGGLPPTLGIAVLSDNFASSQSSPVFCLMVAKYKI